MQKISYLFVRLFFILAFCNNNADTLAQLIKRDLTKMLQHSTTFAYWWISASFFVKKHLAQICHYDRIDEVLHKMPDAPRDVQRFVKNELRRLGFKKADTTQVKMDGSKSGFGCLHNTIIIGEHSFYGYPGSGLISLEAAITNYENKKNTKETLLAIYTSRAILAHEKNHLEAKDDMRRSFVGLMIPFANHCALKKLLDYCAPQHLHLHYYLQKQLLKIPAGFAMYELNMLLYKKFVRYTEIMADEKIPNDTIMLQALASLFDHLEKKEVQEQSFLQKLNNLYAEHPTHADRAKRFKERISQMTNQP